MSEKWITQEMMDKVLQEPYDPTTPEHVEAAAKVDQWLRDTDRPDVERIRSEDLPQWARDRIAKEQRESAAEQDDRRG